MKNYFKKVAMAMLLLAMANVCAARQWHVNNYMGIKADFASIDAAMASEEVVEGDTIYIGAGCVLGSQTISKKVTVIGTGWGYSDSPATVAKINGDVTITAQGAEVVGLYASGKCYVNANNITVQRCRFSSIGTGISMSVSSVRIFSCYTGHIGGISYYDGHKWEIKNNIIDANTDYSLSFLYNAKIENNIIRNTNTSTSSYQGVLFHYCPYSIVKNNVLICISKNSGNSVSNCTNTTIEHNVMSMSTGFSDTNIMLGSTELSNIFNCAGSVESGEYYSLKEGSPAIAAGEGSIDCGVMVGAYKFVPYGRPDNIPVIKQLLVPDSPTNDQINVTVEF